MAFAQVGAGAAALGFGTWWTLLSVIALPSPRRTTLESGVRFVVIVPAHNEERLIATTVASLRAATYDPSPEILVVADNCSDRTAEVARSAGARVLERNDPTLRGKSFALDFALDAIRSSTAPPDAVVIVDADTTVDTGFFGALAETIERYPVAQARYDAAPSQSELGRMRRVAFNLMHHARPLGAARLGLPTTLKGNGMAFRWSVVEAGMPGSGITEDAAATIDLASRGLTVRYAPNARVSGLMAEGYAEARTQDVRWESGRFALVPGALRVLAASLGRGEVRAAAAAAEVASPPLTIVAGWATLSAVLGLLGFGSLRLGLMGFAGVASYVLVGSVAARTGPRDILALLHAPRFIAHKLASYVQAAVSRPKGWERTTRG